MLFPLTRKKVVLLDQNQKKNFLFELFSKKSICIPVKSICIHVWVRWLKLYRYQIQVQIWVPKIYRYQVQVQVQVYTQYLNLTLRFLSCLCLKDSHIYLYLENCYIIKLKHTRSGSKPLVNNKQREEESPKEKTKKKRLFQICQRRELCRGQ